VKTRPQGYKLRLVAEMNAAHAARAKRSVVETAALEVDDATLDLLIRHARRGVKGAELSAVPEAWAAQWTRMGIGPEHFARMAGELRGRSGR